MTGRSSGARDIRAGGLVVALAFALLLAGCTDPGASQRPTDPRAILVGAVRATAALPTVRVRAEMAVAMGLQGGMGDGRMTAVLDADIDLVNRQLAARMTVRGPAGFGGGGDFVTETVVTRAATFTRMAGEPRWQKMPAMPGQAGPTNEQIARMIEQLVADPEVRLELAETTACSLGTCDHVVARVGGGRLIAAMAPVLGMPQEMAGLGPIPDFDFDVRVDQATSLLSEIRYAMTMQGTKTELVLTISNPGAPLQIVAPPAALVDDPGEGFGGFGGFGGGGEVTTILEEVGSELETPWPDDPEPSFEP